MNRSTVHVWAATILIILVALVVWVASFDTRTHASPGINGDTVGIENGESLDSYVARADATMKEAGAEERFALVTFTRPIDAGHAATVLGDVQRVSAVIIGRGAPIALPEPLAGEGRDAVFHRTFNGIGQALGTGQFPVPAPEEMTAVVVWDGGAELRELANNAEVLAVEALPPDAAWGQFGIRPVPIPGAAESVPGV
ncbi:hypothetical protein [Corynebacterium renale]|uniref:Uncharacterized protein n=1 Tax=Corynebacterium renale TaxID=1724 RepID=A0A2A9DPX7_9CORY|nr:hypothetical protein [Corynebacterium renale]PFG28421.1 hypothetical protein ATK06_1532 [Corynebacterium renale]SQI26436.1 putative secreted protein [Corynebacterium renale]